VLNPPEDEFRRHSFGGEGSHPASKDNDTRGSTSHPNTPPPGYDEVTVKKSFFGKVKDKVIGTKEEREAAEREREAEKREELLVCGSYSYTDDVD
jgi:hypothetical protein